MANPIIEDIKLKIKSGNPITRLIIINIAVFFIISIARIITFFSGESDMFMSVESFIKNNLALPLSFMGLALKPWTLITYMFTHYAFMHLFWNLITLYWFAEIVSNYTSTKKIVPLYLLGGVAGAIISIFLIQLIPAFHPLIDIPIVGASAGVTSIVVAAATLLPNYKMNLMFIGPVKLIYLAMFVLFIGILNMASYSNIGGELSHLGGGLMGYVFIVQYKKGKDLSVWINRFLDWISGLFKISSRSKLKVAYKRHVPDDEYNYNKKISQQQIDAILDKISRSGYESLSKSEKEILFKASK